MCSNKLVTVFSATVVLILSGTASATQPTYGEFKLDFAAPPRRGEPNKLVARFVFWMSCQEGELYLSIPEIGDDPSRNIKCWNGPVVNYDTISASIEIPALPMGAYQFRAECRTRGCGAFPEERGGAAVSAWVTAEGILTAPFGYDYGMLDTILNHLQIKGLGNATKQEIRTRSPQLYRLMYYDLTIPPDSVIDPRKDPTIVEPPFRLLAPERTVRRLGRLRGVRGDQDSSWKSLTQHERDSIAVEEWRRRSDSVH